MFGVIVKDNMLKSKVDRPTTPEFSHSLAFSRTIGWVTPGELERLKNKRVAIAGLGGVGGHYCELLARLGVENFHIADFDRFELQNFNRQAGATMENLGRLKTEVARERILAINPSAKITVFSDGVSPENFAAFTNQIDFYVDGLDFFVLRTRFLLFDELHKRGVPFITVAPLGMGASVVFFDEFSMAPLRYFSIPKSELSEDELALRFLLGVSPKLKHSQYLVDRNSINFRERRAPSTPMACYLCAGLAGSYALKVLLGRGQVVRAPWSWHIDGYLNSATKEWLPMGGNSPWQRFKRARARRNLMGKS